MHERRSSRQNANRIRNDSIMLEQIHAPSEDGRKVQMMICLAMTAFGVFTSLNSGMVLPPGAAVGAAMALLGLAGLATMVQRKPRVVD
jgi:hypothetical protein